MVLYFNNSQKHDNIDEKLQNLKRSKDIIILPPLY